MTWYKNGLKFSCSQCGKCCCGSPGYVWLSKEDIDRISKFLQITEKEFIKRYVRNVYFRYSLKERPKENFSCIFLKNGKCQIYSVRPIQCRVFPFWPRNLSSQQAWKEIACEGIDKGKFFSKEEIDRILQEYLSEDR